ncbi:hypothetical protein JOC70_003807 [Clostridium pascui]|uniref:phage/plasmid replication domain-containing protein n=1 Tax=Clostridium pascui TaxID=46609 RepID=UPI00195B9FF4|nr:phage/plasmid replication protein [Clostridium pascui]MBM7872252.1 hypothetical protein [Clostridium pascui]
MIHTLSVSMNFSRHHYEELADLLGIDENTSTVTKDYSSIGFREIRLLKTINQKIHYYGIEIKLNPKVLITGREDIGIISEKDINLLCEKFNNKMKNDIAPGMDLLEFNNWTCKRIDYTTDIKVNDVKSYIRLFKKGDKPSSFKIDLKEAGSLYLKSNSVIINFYDKEDEQLKKVLRKDENLSDSRKEAIKDILRLEVQCLPSKVNSIKRKKKFKSKSVIKFLSKDISEGIILSYYDATVGIGDYYTLEEAKKIIFKCNYTERLKNSLISAMQLVAQSRSIWRAREQFVKGVIIKNTNPYVKLKGTKATFNNYIKLLSNLGINAVAIPREWGINYMPNIRKYILNKFIND